VSHLAVVLSGHITPGGRLVLARGFEHTFLPQEVIAVSVGIRLGEVNLSDDGRSMYCVVQDVKVPREEKPRLVQVVVAGKSFDT
jgi:hypothetical protein